MNIIQPRRSQPIIRHHGWESMRYLMRELIRTMGGTGVEAVQQLMFAIADSVQVSFSKEHAPMRNITEGAIKERIDKAVEICLELVERDYAVHRISDEIPRLLLESLDAKEKSKSRERRTWGVKDNVLLTTDGESF